MKITSQHQVETLIEERLEEMISPYNNNNNNNNNSTWRNAHFLKPSLLPPSNSPLLLNPIKTHFSNYQNISSKVNFHGWRSPLKQWSSWVESLRPKFEPLWRKTSIDQPIKASTFDIPKHKDLIFALAERFCPDTNTFVFPWGEATITLEDVMVLGGYSVTGDSVLTTYTCTELCEIEGSLHCVRMEIVRSKSKKASHSKWVEKWMGNGVEFEHEAFLSLWLSRVVFPCDSHDSMNKSVFPIAVLLAKGTKIALAPAVLARMYRDLRLLKEKIESFRHGDDEDMTKLNLSSPLLLLQLWVWERFPTLSPKPNPFTTTDQPRLARWNKVSISNKDDVGFALDCAKQCFVWRPYTKPLNNWSSFVKLYPKTECWVAVGSDVIDLDLESYVRFIRVSELVGLDCIEQYLPHRVSMQFGLDQDVPMSVPRLKCVHNIAWNYYNRPINMSSKLYVPSRLFESDVTLQYLKWWKKSSIEKVESGSVQRLSVVKMENNQADIPPGFTCPSKLLIPNVCSYQSSSNQQWDDNNNTKGPSSNIQITSNEVMEEADCDHLKLTQQFHDKGWKRRKKDFEKDEMKGRSRSMDKEEVKSELVTRISGLERIVNMLKAGKIRDQNKIHH